MTLKLNGFLKEKKVDFHSKEIDQNVVKLILNKSIPTKENIYFFAFYKIEVGLKLD